MFLLGWMVSAAVAERGELLGSDLGGMKPQAWPAGGVVDDRVEGQVAGVAASQTGLDDDHHEVPGGDGGSRSSASADSIWAMT